VLPMVLGMADTAITPSLPDTGSEPEFRPSARERLGIGLFLFAAVGATATWIGLLVWGAVKLVDVF
jgi:hypothetical protein